MPSRIGTVLRQFGPMVYLPTILFALGEGAVIPLIPVIASKMGADLALAALVASALVVGQLCGNIPAGWLVSRVGERVTMMIAGTVASLVSLALLIAPTHGALTGAVFLLGFCASAFGLARHAFMTTRVPLELRARSLSLLGGSFRLGIFVGPFIAALLLQAFGDEHATVWFLLGCLVLTILLVSFGPDPEKTHPILHRGLALPKTEPIAEDTGEPVTGSIPVHERVGVFGSMWRHRQVLSRLGLAAASISAVRSARFVVLPLWGVSLGLDAQTISVVVGVSGAIDFALFYASGQVMDRFGRLWAALPAMLLMGGSFLALAFTHGGDLAILWYGMFAATLGVGNGLSSGILLTLGADTAPQADPATYLGSWRTLTDAGGAASPLLFAGIAAIAPLSVATGTIGVIGLLGAWALVVWIPKFVPRA